MIPLIQSKKIKKIKITNKKNSLEKGENNFISKTPKIFLIFLLLIISIELLKLNTKINFIKNKSKYPTFLNYNNSTLKSQYFTRFDNVFSSYRNETELSDEYKNKFKKYLLDGYSSLFKKKYKNIDVIIFNRRMNFGNAIFVINNLIYFCEILGCTKIYLYRDYWFIKKPIYDKELNITISPLTIDIWNNQSSIYFDSKSKFCKIVKLFKNNFIPVRTYILKNELFSNIKLIDTKLEDLYINIRSGKDVFKRSNRAIYNYIQPPLCFYETIISMFNFSNIYIISNGKENPVINKLLKSYNNIKYFHGTVKEDVSIILSAKNLVLPCSSFSVELIKLSDNLKNLFEFNLISKTDRNYWHFNDRHLKPLKFNRFIMNPTEEYIKVMKPWRHSKEQCSKMVNEKCIKKFKIIPSDFV
jgi:hypothetical protein